MAGEADAFLLLILSFLFPPAAVAFIAGCGADLCLNILLTLLGYLPGCIHAFWLVIKRAEANDRYGYKNWIYTGMGEYLPYDLKPPSTGQTSVPYGQPRGPPPTGPQPPGKAPSPGQAPVDQKQGGYGYAQQTGSAGGYPATPQAPGGYGYTQQQPAPAGGYPASPQVPVDQKSGGGYLPPPAPAEQKYAYQALPQVPSDQKQADSASGTAPPGGT